MFWCYASYTVMLHKRQCVKLLKEKPFYLEGRKAFLSLAASLPYTLSWVILCLIISLQPSVCPALPCILHLESVIRNIEFWALQEEIMIRWALEWDPESYISTTNVFGSKPGLGTTVLGDHHDHRVTDFSGDII